MYLNKNMAVWVTENTPKAIIFVPYVYRDTEKKILGSK